MAICNTQTSLRFTCLIHLNDLFLIFQHPCSRLIEAVKIQKNRIKMNVAQTIIREHLIVKFGLFEKHTKFEKICLMTNQLIYLVNVKTIRQIFSNYVCFSESPNFTDLPYKL